MKEHIVVIDDDKNSVNQMIHILKSEGYTVSEVTEGDDISELLEQIFNLSPDLILSDISMSPNGFDFLTAVKQDARLRIIPFIFVTGVGESRDEIKAYSQGADNYITKPIDKDEILAKVFSVLERQRDMSTAMYLDPLTGIYNRRYFNQELIRQLRLHKRHGDELTLCIIDLDHFKNVNDKYGHSAGDTCLVAFTKLVNDEIRSTDIFARWGGEEFVLILERAKLEGSERTLNKILDTVKSKPLFHYADEDINITFSAGLAQFPMHATEPLDLINAADQAVYDAKRAGRCQVKIYNPDQ
ncbi:MAG: diguanylate cyclase [Fidelibacterota bacterium]